ncbi:hypothetical protein [Methylomonas lenta]|uniref:hypothetical protein n=1 Tax=Methylomonas lenta TaxID=980561 RepID=UPI00082EB337|nr:hypothetical protein [Methylomonas lenta]
MPDRGAARKPRVFRKGWDALSKKPVQTRGAQDQRGMGWPFFWILFFGRPKKSIAVAGPRTGVKLSVATRHHNNKQILRNLNLVPCGSLPHRTLRTDVGETGVILLGFSGQSVVKIHHTRVRNAYHLKLSRWRKPKRYAVRTHGYGNGVVIPLMPLRKTPLKPEERREKAAWGGLSFGYFSLAVQRKVSRLPVREPALN